MGQRYKPVLSDLYLTNLTMPAVRKMTSKPPARVHLSDRGILLPGMVADLAIFDPSIISDKATFKDPNQYSVGVKHVLVNGEFVVLNGSITAARQDAFFRDLAIRRHRPDKR